MQCADNGQGVPDEHLPHLFEKFWRGDDTPDIRNGEGSGIGLYSAKRIVEAHGGRIEAMNNKGLEIKISLPRRKGERE
jgi:signal transduction histidine kinase